MNSHHQIYRSEKEARPVGECYQGSLCEAYASSVLFAIAFPVGDHLSESELTPDRSRSGQLPEYKPIYHYRQKYNPRPQKSLKSHETPYVMSQIRSRQAE